MIEQTPNSQAEAQGSPVGLSWSCASPSSLCPPLMVPLSPYVRQLTAPGQEHRFAAPHPSIGTAGSEHCSNTGRQGRRGSMRKELEKGTHRVSCHLTPPHISLGCPITWELGS